MRARRQTTVRVTTVAPNARAGPRGRARFRAAPPSRTRRNKATGQIAISPISTAASTSSPRAAPSSSESLTSPIPTPPRLTSASTSTTAAAPSEYPTHSAARSPKKASCATSTMPAAGSSTLFGSRQRSRSTAASSTRTARKKAAMRHPEPITSADSPPRALTRRELEHGAGATPARRPPGSKRRRYVEHVHAPIEEHRIDGKAHERRVDGAGGAEENPLAGLERGTAEQAPQTSGDAVGERAGVAHDAARAIEDAGGHSAAPTQCLDDAVEAREKDDDEYRRQDQEGQWEQHLDRSLLRLLLNDLAAARSQIAREVAHDLADGDAHRLALRDGAAERSHGGRVAPPEHVLERLIQAESQALLLQREPDLLAQGAAHPLGSAAQRGVEAESRLEGDHEQVDQLRKL